MTLTFEQLERLLYILDIHEAKDDFEWIYRGSEGIKFFINTNDIFWWASADLEPIENDEDIENLRKALNDCHNVNEMESHFGTVLYSARKRGMRPQGSVYQNVIPKELWHLFDECGKDRGSGFGNPVDRNELE